MAGLAEGIIQSSLCCGQTAYDNALMRCIILLNPQHL